VRYLFHSWYLELTTAIAPQKKRKGKATKAVDVFADDVRADEGSTSRYEGFKYRNPALKRFNATFLAGRSPNLPLPLYQYETAKQKGFAHIHLLPVVPGHLASFIPPISIFNNPKNPARVTQYVLMTLKLWPLILRRVLVSRKDPAVRPLTASEWRAVLGTEYFQRQWPITLRDESRIAPDFWRFGGEAFFGKAMSKDIVNGMVPTWGRLLCGCEPTKANVEGNKAIVPMVVYGVAHWELLLQFAALAPQSLEGLGVPTIVDGPRKLCVPDFFNADRTRTSGVLGLIKTIVLGSTKDDAIPSHGWLTPFDGPELPTKEKRIWLKAVRSFFLSHAVHRDRFETPDLVGWMSRAELDRAQLASLLDEKLDDIAQELVNRYFVTAILAGQWPAEMLVAPDRGLEHIRCTAHGGEVAKYDPSAWDKDSSDED
jgi:hypothetical protein